MRCLSWILIIGLFVAGLGLAGVAGVAFLIDSQTIELAGLAREAPNRALRDVLTNDGVAWVKVRLEPASGSVPLLCAGQPCLWVRLEEYQTVMEPIRTGGQWTKRPFERPTKDEKKSIPFDLVDGGNRITIADALGVKIWPDLLQERRTELPAELPPDTGSATPARRLESFLPVGVEAWALGRFEGGVPKVLKTGQFVLTGLGPERFNKTLAGNASLLSKIRNWCVAGAILCPLLAVLILWKRR